MNVKKPNNHKKQSKILKKKNKDKQRLNQYRQNNLSLKETKRHAAASLHAIEEILSKIPSSCEQCSSNFDSTDSEHLDDWNMTFNGSKVILTCKDCLEISNEPETNTC